MSRFSRLISTTFSSFNEHKALCTAREFIKMIQKIENVDIFGPVQAPLYLLKKRYRYRLIIRAQKSFNIQKSLQKSLLNIKVDRLVKVKIDVDPYSFL